MEIRTLVNKQLPMSVTNTFVPKQDILEPTQEREVNFMLWTCNYCNMEISLRSGDVLCGDGWYHSNCWVKRSAMSESAKSD
jgi:hypothetical protein